MSWADVKRRYRSGGASAAQSTEDMSARRILRAVGLAEKALPAFERETGLCAEVQPDTTLLERAERAAAMRLQHAHLPPPPVRDVRVLQDAEDAVMEMAEQRSPARLVYRVRGTDRLCAMVRLSSSLVDTDNLPMPCRLARSRDGTAVILTCEADAFYGAWAQGRTA